MSETPDRMRALQRAWRDHIRSAKTASQDSGAAIGLVGSFTIDPLIPYLGAMLLETGVNAPSLHNANYNQVLRVCRNHESEFGDARLDAIALLWRLEDLADPTEPDQVRRACELFCDGLSTLRERFPGMIIVTLPPRPRSFTADLIGFSRPSPLFDAWCSALTQISAIAKTQNGLYVVDCEAAIAAVGEQAAIDHRKELLYRQPYSDGVYVHLAAQISRIYRCRACEPKKCLVVDCDNTIWGGVVGEDGVAGVQLSDDFPGSAFRHFQRQLAALRNSGVFIALNSKNNPADVWEMFDKNDAMALRREDISAARINWRPKSENLKEIASDLNIGLDALVFMDDSSFEIEEVRAHAPEVTCIQIPDDPADIPIVMREIARYFDRLDITADDTTRVDMMQQEMGRRDLAQKMTEEEFLASLGLKVFLFRPEEADLARVTQLINKTNQFNVTTRRYTLQDVRQMMSDVSSDLYCASVRDKFGDYGLVGIAILNHQGDVSEFDTLLMSCRVLGRGIETSIIAMGVQLAGLKGASTLRGRYIPSRKNAMVADLFQRHGFAEASSDGTDGEAAVIWHRPVDDMQMPAFLAVHESRPT